MSITATSSPSASISPGTSFIPSSTPSFNPAQGEILPPPPANTGQPQLSASPSRQPAAVESGEGGTSPTVAMEETVLAGSDSPVQVVEVQLGEPAVVSLEPNTGNLPILFTANEQQVRINLGPNLSSLSNSQLSVTFLPPPPPGSPANSGNISFQSQILSITLQDAFGNVITNFDHEIELCFTVESANGDNQCLNYYNVLRSEWVCIDDSLQPSGNLVWFVFLFVFIPLHSTKTVTCFTKQWNYRPFHQLCHFVGRYWKR